MKHYVLTWMDEDASTGYISIMTNATGEQIDEIYDDIKEIFKSKLDESENTNPLKLDPYEQAVVELFHSKNYLCTVLSLQDVIEFA